MSKIKSKVLSFGSSDSPDVVSYKLYVAAAGEDLTYESEAFDLGMVTSVDLSAIPALTAKDGVFSIGVTAIDDGGNESDMSVVNGVALDFLAPNPPGSVSVA